MLRYSKGFPINDRIWSGFSWLHCLGLLNGAEFAGARDEERIVRPTQNLCGVTIAAFPAGGVLPKDKNGKYLQQRRADGTFVSEFL